ncbi:MAG: ABC transporter substrate-binding protein [Bdellovibrionota bacterium]
MKLQLILILIFSQFMLTFSYAADKISIGVPEFDKEINLLKSPSIAAQISRSGLVAGLTKLKNEGHIPYSLDIADNMTVSSDFSSISFRIAGGRNFNNNTPIEPIDVLYSINRCMLDNIIEGVSNSRIEKKDDKLLSGSWVTLNFMKPSPEVSATIPVALASCPIIDSQSSYLFGEKLGSSTMLVSSGDFAISLFKPGRSIELARVATQSVSKGPSSIEIRGFSDSNRALTALRLGTVDVVFVENEDTLLRASQDETVLISSCLGSKIILRKGLRFKCSPTLNFESIEYVG